MQPQVANKNGEENNAGHGSNDVEMQSNSEASAIVKSPIADKYGEKNDAGHGPNDVEMKSNDLKEYYQSTLETSYN